MSKDLAGKHVGLSLLCPLASWFEVQKTLWQGAATQKQNGLDASLAGTFEAWLQASGHSLLSIWLAPQEGVRFAAVWFGR